MSNEKDATVVSSANKLAILPNIVAGYSNGTVRMFDLNRVEMTLKMHPHAVAVTAIKFSADGNDIHLPFIFCFCNCKPSEPWAN